MAVFEQGDNGPVQIWEFPDPNHRYVIGADVAEGLEHGDYSDASVLDVNNGELVAKWHGHIPPREFGHELATLGRYYNLALIGCESNNHGVSTIDALREVHYPRIFRKRTIGEISKKTTIKWGWSTNRVSKPLMIDALDEALREGSITIWDRHTLAELRTYVRDEKGHLHGSPHDDRVISLAISVQMLGFVNSNEADEFEQKDTRWTVDWWRRQGDRQHDPEVKPIGFHNRRRYG